MSALLLFEALLLGLLLPIAVRAMLDAEVRRLAKKTDPTARANASESAPQSPPPEPDRESEPVAREAAERLVRRFGLPVRDVVAVYRLRLPAAFSEWPAAAQEHLRLCLRDGCFRGPKLAQFVAQGVHLQTDESVYLAHLRSGTLVAFVDRVPA